MKYNIIAAALIAIIIIVTAYYVLYGYPNTGPGTIYNQTFASIVNSVYNNNAGGNILVNIQGMTLYTLSSDPSGSSTCYDGCAGIWPALTIGSGTQPTESGAAGVLDTFARTDGGFQVTFNGRPLYLYSGDSGPGTINGEGIVSFGGTWRIALV
jgi:predicted lipoprotein with Yx(FWY)xxD motif